jgi:uncharacterized membrane protein YbhN (UPF0104 family)
MTVDQNAGPPPEAPADRAQRHRGRRRPVVRWIMHGALFVALVAGLFGLLPRLGGLTHEAAGLRHARPAFLAAATVAQALSLGCYALLYRQVLAALGARARFRLAADVTLATFFVSHLTPFGSATGTLVNTSALETEGVAAATTGEAIVLTGLTATIALIVLVFLALRYQPGFGPLAVAYVAANIASAIPLTPGGLGVIEVTLVAITAGFGAPRATAVLAVLGYRIVNFWLPLLPGAVAYLRLRLRQGAGGERKGKGK